MPSELKDPPDGVSSEALLHDLIETLLRHPDASHRRDAAVALGAFGQEFAASALARALRDPAREVRAAASSALAALGTPATGVLLEALADGNWVVRYRAAEALGSIRDERALPALLRHLGDERDHVRYMAARSLGRLGDARARETLLAALADENRFVRRAAADSLAVLRGKKGGGTGQGDTQDHQAGNSLR